MSGVQEAGKKNEYRERLKEITAVLHRHAVTPGCFP